MGKNIIGEIDDLVKDFLKQVKKFKSLVNDPETDLEDEEFDRLNELKQDFLFLFVD